MRKVKIEMATNFFFFCVAIGFYRPNGDGCSFFFFIFYFFSSGWLLAHASTLKSIFLFFNL